MARRSSPLLLVDEMSAGYGAAIAVQRIRLRVGEGEVVALVGANGAGKTTILRAISGLLRPSDGVVELDGRRIDRLGTHAIVDLGIAHVPEGRGIFGDQSVEDNLLLGAFRRYARGDRREIGRDAEGLMLRFPILGARRRQPAGLLSGGEQQQLAIARGLMGRPRLLMLDEPSLGLGPLLVRQVVETIAELRREGVSILLVEQLAFRALEVADRGYVLQAGRIRAEGTAAALMAEGEVARSYFGTGGGLPATPTSDRP